MERMRVHNPAPKIDPSSKFKGVVVPIAVDRALRNLCYLIIFAE
jgi:hypothetical protein